MNDMIKQLEEENTILKKLISSVSDSILLHRTPGGIDKIIDHCVDLIHNLSCVEMTGIFLVNDETNFFELHQSKPDDKSTTIQKEVDHLIEEGIFAWALDKGHPVIVDSFSMPSRKTVIAPIATMDRLMGVIVIITDTCVTEIEQTGIKIIDTMATQYALIMRDISFRKYFERELDERTSALRTSEQTFREIFDFAMDPILIIDAYTKTIIFANKATCKICEISREECLEQQHEEIKWVKSSSSFIKGIEDTLKNGQSKFSQEIESEHGKRWQFEINASVISIWGKKAIHCILRDISEIRLIEENLKRAKDEAEKANQLKSSFLATMSHEIRTPINGIIGMADLVLQTEMSPEQKENLLTIQECSKSLLTVINDILDFSKIEAGRLDLEIINLDLHEVTNGVIKTLKHYASQKKLKLTCMMDNDAPSQLFGDSVRLRQVLLNLSHNALKFTHTGKVTLSTEVLEQTEHEVKICFSITDTGIGIPKDRQDIIFNPFTQADSSTTRRYGGTGLGLSISVRLVEMMGGKLNLESAVGEGSRFWFTLSFKKDIAAQDSRSDRIESKQSVNSYNQHTQSGRILVVEDNPVNLKIAVAMLSKAGFTVDTAENGQSAITMLKVWVYDLILMDVQMPDIDGLEVTRIFRSMEGNKRHTPVIAVTAHAMSGDREICLNAGMDDYITKPLNREELYRVLDKWISNGVQGNISQPLTVSQGNPRPADTPIDIETALSRFDNDMALFTELLKVFYDKIRKQLQTLDVSVKEGNSAMVLMEAHSIKGAASTLSADKIASLAYQLEKMGREGDLTGADDILRDMETSIEKLQEFVTDGEIVIL